MGYVAGMAEGQLELNEGMVEEMVMNVDMTEKMEHGVVEEMVAGMVEEMLEMVQEMMGYVAGMVEEKMELAVVIA